MDREERQHAKKTTVYLPQELDLWIRIEARRNRRSYNSELVWLLEQQRARQEKGNQDATR